jgi:hypothetical protein
MSFNPQHKLYEQLKTTGVHFLDKTYDVCMEYDTFSLEPFLTVRVFSGRHAVIEEVFNVDSPDEAVDQVQKLMRDAAELLFLKREA